MIRISTPATSANLSVGFDALGIAIDIYNDFLFEESKTFQVNGFNPKYNNNNNLVISSYTAFAKKYAKDIIPVKVTLENEDIPISRGLGSSASCILAGVLASNLIHNLYKSILECASFASELEGHPDNIFSCSFGHLTASFKGDTGYVYKTFPINKDYRFTLLVPETKGSTEDLRNALKKEIKLEDTVFHLSRMIHVPHAISGNDFSLLKELLQDKVHELYRFPFIPRYQELLELRKDDDKIVCISGSGSTVLIISKSSIKDDLKHLSSTFDIKEVNITTGVKVEVLS